MSFIVEASLNFLLFSIEDILTGQHILVNGIMLSTLSNIKKAFNIKMSQIYVILHL